MRVAVVHNEDTSGVINVFGAQNREKYNPKTVERVARALESGGHTVRVIDGNMHVVEQLHDFMPKVMSGARPGMVFNMAYGIQGVSRYTHLPAMLEMLGVPYVGSGPQAHGLALDKVVAKMVFESEGVPTPGFWNFATPDAYYDDLVFPVIVKPKMEAVSYGIRVVSDWDELHESVAEIMHEFQQHVLVESFIPGREFAVGLLGNSPPDVLPIVEIDLGGDPDAIQTADEKLHVPREKICPAVLDEAKAEELRELARRSFDSLGLYDFARIDVRMDEKGDLYVLEINSMASLGQTGSYVHAAKTAGYTYDSLINRMLDVAAVRYFGEAYLEEVRTPIETKPPERAKLSTRVRSHVRSNQMTTEHVLRQMVDLHTPATNSEHVNSLGEFLVAQLEPLGFSAHTHDHVDTGNSITLANHDGDTHDVLLLSHIDSAPGRPFQRYRAEGTRLYGSGIAEHKGGLAAMVAALRALRYARRLRNKTRVGILLTADETLGGARGRSLVESEAARSRAVVALKAGGYDGSVLVSRSGRASYTAELVYAKEPDDLVAGGAEAVATLARRAQQLAALSDKEAGYQVAVTELALTAAFESLVEAASLSLTVRFNLSEQGAMLDEQVRRVLKRAPKGARFAVRGGVKRPPRQSTPESEALFASVAEIADDLNLQVGMTHRWHSSDLCFVPEQVPALDGFGPVGTGERTVEEHIVRGTLTERAALLALTIAHCATLPELDS